MAAAGSLLTGCASHGTYVPRCDGCKVAYQGGLIEDLRLEITRLERSVKVANDRADANTANAKAWREQADTAKEERDAARAETREAKRTIKMQVAHVKRLAKELERSRRR